MLKLRQLAESIRVTLHIIDNFLSAFSGSVAIKIIVSISVAVASSYYLHSPPDYVYDWMNSGTHSKIKSPNLWNLFSIFLTMFVTIISLMIMSILSNFRFIRISNKSLVSIEEKLNSIEDRHNIISYEDSEKFKFINIREFGPTDVPQNDFPSIDHSEDKKTKFIMSFLDIESFESLMLSNRYMSYYFDRRPGDKTNHHRFVITSGKRHAESLLVYLKISELLGYKTSIIPREAWNSYLVNNISTKFGTPKQGKKIIDLIEGQIEIEIECDSMHAALVPGETWGQSPNNVSYSGKVFLSNRIKQLSDLHPTYQPADFQKIWALGVAVSNLNGKLPVNEDDIEILFGRMNSSLHAADIWSNFLEISKFNPNWRISS